MGAGLMTAEHDSEKDEPERAENFSVTGPLEIELDLSVGRLELHLDEPTEDGEETPEATVRVRHDPAADNPWAGGVRALLNRLGDSIGEPWAAPLGEAPAAEALDATHIEHSGGKLRIVGPTTLRTRTVPLAVTVCAPAGSHLRARTTSAGVAVTGRAGNVETTTGSGSVSVTEAHGKSSVRTGSGEIGIGRVAGTLSLRTGSGTTDITELGGNADMVTGTAMARIGTLDGDLFVRAGSGDLDLADARSGSVELISGSGDIRIGIGRNTLAGIDISSGAGRTHAELDVSETPPETDTTLAVHARSGTGDVTLTSGASDF